MTYSEFIQDAAHRNLPINYMERIPTVIASILMTSDPQVPDENKNALCQMLYDAAMNSMTSGRGYMLRYEDNIYSPDTSMVFDGVEGEHYTLSLHTTLASTGTPDLAEVTTFFPNGSVVSRFQEWNNNSNFGEILSSGATQGLASFVDRLPVKGGFGRSMYNILAPPVVAYSARMSGIDYTIAANLQPLMGICCSYCGRKECNRRPWSRFS